MTTLRCRVCDREYKSESFWVTVRPWPTCHGQPMVVQRVTTAKGAAR